MHTAHPDTFRTPSQQAASCLQPGDFVKVAIDGERFWVEVSVAGRNAGSYIGIVANDLITTDCGVTLGDEIELSWRNIYDILSF